MNEKTSLSENVKLNRKQKLAVDMMMRGENVFLTGPSGTGKSTVVHYFKNIVGSTKKIAITSTTGISALLIGGTTLHSYLGIGLGNQNVQDTVKMIMSRPNIRKRWETLDVLVIDEVSMLSPQLFDKLEEVAKIVRFQAKMGRSLLLKVENMDIAPFGGIQLILSGDFLQLPVVGSDDFCFEAESWGKCVKNVVCLDEICRQTDRDFQKALNDLRFGNVSTETKKLLKSRVGAELKNDFGILPTEIHTTNRDVDIINQQELEKLNVGDTEFYEYKQEVYFYEYVKNQQLALEKIRKNCIAPEVLMLCKNTQVMLLCNLDLPSGLVNGSRGVVVDFQADYPVVRFLNGQERLIMPYSWTTEENEKKTVMITQVPLKLAYALTVHKSQGATLDYAKVRLDNVFTFGQAYVSLSRVKSKEGLSIIAIDWNCIQGHPKGIEFYKKYEQK